MKSYSRSFSRIDPSSSFLLPFLLLVIAIITNVESYVTFKTYIPPTRQRQWLTKLTVDICDSPTGSQLIDTAPEVLRGWSTSKDVTAENAMAVESLFKRLVEESKAGQRDVNPTTLDYNIILNLWVKSKEGGVFAAERCEQILTTMQQLYHQTNDYSVQPNLESFKSVLLAWKNSNVPFAPIRAQRMLEWMIRLYEAGENDALPDSDCFDIVLQIWSRSNDPKAANKAESLLLTQDKLSQIVHSHKLKPTTLSFNAVLNAWGKKISKETPESQKMVAMLGLMEHLYFEQGNRRVEPDRCTYNIVLLALAKGCSEKTACEAETILRSIETHYKDDQLSWQPDAFLFNAAICSWAHADVPGAYRKAQSILDRQMNLYKKGDGCQECEPDVIGFTSVMASCASEPKKAEKPKAFMVALSTFQILEKNPSFGAPNHVTYGTMLKACARLLPPSSPERTKWTKHYFQKAKNAGMVGSMVLGRLREACTPQEYKQLMSGNSKDALPKEWTCNVHERRVSIDKRH